MSTHNKLVTLTSSLEKSWLVRRKAIQTTTFIKSLSKSRQNSNNLWLPRRKNIRLSQATPNTHSLWSVFRTLKSSEFILSFVSHTYAVLVEGDSKCFVAPVQQHLKSLVFNPTWLMLCALLLLGLFKLSFLFIKLFL